MHPANEDQEMQMIRIFAYICFGLAALGVFLALVEEFFFIFHAMVIFVTGALFMALDKIITTLVEIRDALLMKSRSIDVEMYTGSDDSHPSEVESKTVRTVQEIQADMDRLKSRLR